MKLRAYLFLTLMLGGMAANLAAQQTPLPANPGNPSVPKTEKLLSDELNKELPKWLRFSGEYRARLEGFTGGGFKPHNDDLYLLSRLRLNMLIQANDWVKFAFQAQDAYVFWKNQNPPAPPYQDAMDLRLGYFEIGDEEKKQVDFRAGRQELAFGDERLVGNTNWLNTARSFDALRGAYHRGGYRIDMFASRVVKAVDGEFDWSTPGTNFYGLYGGADKLVPNATVEPYFFWRRAANLAMETGGKGTLNFGTYGLRWAGKLPASFDYGTEIDKQAGSLGSNSVAAWAGHWVVGHTFASAKVKPRVSVEYNYASGDHNTHDGKIGTFDQLYPTAHDKYGLADQVGWKNIRNARTGVELKLAAKWGLIGRYDAWWLADPHDALYSASSAVVASSPSGLAGRFVGQEIDSVIAYNLSRQLQLSGGYGHIFPGTFLKNTTPGKSFNFPYASTTLVF
ncbi:MAG TPA: alginate export family protein [Candidatus Sulfotelmatobacter sp.]|nr:alginate export family protein [Candidatus Sulfotelmatobacter sp.]